MCGESLNIHKCWQTRNHKRAQNAFVFSEINFFRNKNYHCLLLQPLAFESQFHMLMNLPAMFYSGILIEKHLGIIYFIGIFIANCITSAGVQLWYQRQIGYRDYRRRGRMANFNGNISMFFISFLTGLLPNYKIYSGQKMATTFYFYYLLVAYCLIYFTQMQNFRKNVIHARNDNETHYSGLIIGGLLGIILRKRLISKSNLR